MSQTSQRDLGKSDSPIEDELEDAFTRMIDEGTQRLHRSWREVLVTGFFGGTEVAMGVLAYLSVLRATHDPLLAGLAFSIGFLALLLGRSELFTEGFLVPVTTVAAKRASPLQLLKLWGGTLAANLVGGWLIMGLIMTAFPQLRDQTVDLTFVERRDDSSISADALGDLEPMPAWDQRGGSVLEQIVEIGPCRAPQLQHVPEAARGDECSAGALLLEDRVGNDRGRMRQQPDVGSGDAVALHSVIERRQHALGQVARRGRHLGDADGSARIVDQRHVRERAADVDTYPPGHCCFVSRERVRAQFSDAIAASTASPSRSTMVSMSCASTINGGASSTWSPRTPSSVPPMG